MKDLQFGAEGTLGHIETLGSVQSPADVAAQEVRSAGQIIARNFFVRRYVKYVKKKILVERLLLEDAVGRGVVRLVLYSLIFVFIVACLNFGASSGDKRRVMTLLQADLELDDWPEIRAIGQLREILPRLSDSLKKYSASSNARFDSDDSVVILRENQKFLAARQLFTVDPDVTGSFTFTAWVGGMPNRILQEPISIIRMPMESRRSQSCWGWFHPSTFRYGAHDFHSLQSGLYEEAVNGTTLVPATLTHEAVIVENGFISFFRNGKQEGARQRLIRPITNCLAGAALELGGENIELSALLFYARALQPTEIEELFQAGKPLVEVATASTIQSADEDSLNQVEAAVQESQLELTEELRRAAFESRINAIMNRESANEGGLVDPLFPADPSPPPILPKGDAVVAELSDDLDQGQSSDRQYWIDSRQRQRWIDGGRMTTGPANSTWATDEYTPDLGQFWSVFEYPVLCDGTEFGTLPTFDTQSDGMTVSFWFKSSKTSLGRGPNLRVVQGPETGSEPTFFDVSIELDWVAMTMDLDGQDSQYAWRFMTGFDDVTGQVDENFLLYAFAQSPKPNVWRHLVFQYSMETRSILHYLDGVLFADTKDVSDYGGSLQMQAATVGNIFSGGTVVPHSFKALSSMQDVAGTMAGLRFYDRLLSADEVQLLHSQSRWPGPEPVLMQQCANGNTDMSYADSLRTDFYGNPCSWWFSVAQDFPWVCSAVWLKHMCPVTCSSVRLCHDGALNHGTSPIGIPQPPARRRFRIFDRIMHLKPRLGQTGMVCPSDRLDKDALLAQCRALSQQDAFYASDPANYTQIADRANKQVQRADLTDCDDLEERLDFEQCAWDASWIDDFAQDFAETGRWSISTWIRAKDGSLGQPTNFWFALTLFSTLSPPLVLSDWTERKPQLEPWMEAHTVVNGDSGQGRRVRASVWPTTVIDYAGSWTFLHMQFESKPDGQSSMCATLNAMKLSCVHNLEPHRFDPLRFIEALELTTEMLISPVEISTEWFSPSEVQQKYYAKADSMSRELGPLLSERDRIAQLNEPVVRENRNFDQTVILMAPPLLFQRRAGKRTCESKVTTPFLQSQLSLMQAAQCTDSLCPNATSVDEVATCVGTEHDFTGKYFGQSKQPLDGKDGYTDFLYAIADNPLVVRDGEILDTETFFDAQSIEGTLLAFFHLAETGLTTELKLTVRFSGAALETDFSFDHYNYVSYGKRRELLVYYAILFLFIGLILVLNVKYYFDFTYEVKQLGVKMDEKGRFEIIYDVVQALILLVFGGVALTNALRSEDSARRIVEDIGAVPFESSTITLENKVKDFFIAVESLHAGFANNAAIDVFAFIIMVLMLVRIIDATAVHPRTGVLVGTLYHGMNDLWHFTILFLVVFFFFSFTSNWMFASEREDFQDLFSAMNTQFDIILGQLPEDFRSDNRMIVYVVFSIVVQFFLMLNFLLAIVVEGYMKVRRDIEANESEGEFFTDVVKTLHAYFLSIVQRWPHRRYVALIIRDRVGSRAVSGYHLLLQGLPHEAVSDMFSHYASMKHLACGPPDWFLPANRYDVVDRVEKEAVKISVENLNSQMSAMRLQLSRVLASMPGAALGPMSPTSLMAPPEISEGILSQAIQRRIRKQPARKSRQTTPANGSPINGTLKASKEEWEPKTPESAGTNGMSTRELAMTSPGASRARLEAASSVHTVNLVNQRKESLEAAMGHHNGSAKAGNGNGSGSARVSDEDFYMALQSAPGLQKLDSSAFMF